MYSTPVKGSYGVEDLNASVGESEDGMVTPVKGTKPSMNSIRKATPSKPNGSANYRCFLDIATSGSSGVVGGSWTEDRASELATTLMAQISAGRDINGTRRSTGATALHTLVKTAPPFVVQAFLSYGADPSIVDLFGRSVLHMAVLNPHYKVARMIWRQILSAKNVRLLFDADGKGLTPLHAAFLTGNLELIGYLLLYALPAALQTLQTTNPNLAQSGPRASDAHQRNLLHCLFEHPWDSEQYEGIVTLVERLVELGVDRFAKDDRHRTPLKAFLQTSHAKSLSRIRHTLLSRPEHETNMPEAEKEATSSNLIVTAFLKGLSPKDVDKSIMLMFKNDNQDWKEDWRPIHQLMQVGEFFQLLPLFIAQCSLEALLFIDTKGRSLLHYLANMGAQKSVIEFFAAQFSFSSTKTRSMRDPETGVSVPVLETHMIHIRELVQKCFDALLSRSDAQKLFSVETVWDNDQQSPLHMAAKWNNVVVLRELFKTYGAESQAWKGVEGQTAMHTAVQFNSVFVLMEMHRLGWNLNPEDGKGQTPYALAIEQRRRSCADLLKHWGANTGATVEDPSVSPDFTSPREGEESTIVDTEVATVAGEAAGSRLSNSLSSFPEFVESSPASPPSDRFTTIVEDEEFDEEDDLTDSTTDSLETTQKNNFDDLPSIGA